MDTMIPHALDDYVEATFAGRVWKLSLGIRAEVEFERRRGKDIGEMLSKFVSESGEFNLKTLVQGFSAEDFCTLVWCMTLKQQRDEKKPIDLEEFIDMVSTKEIRKMFSDVMKAAKAFHGEPHPDDPPVATKEKNGRPLDQRPSGPASGRFAVSRSASPRTRSAT